MVVTGRPNIWRERCTAAAILGVAIMLVYGEIAFMGYTLSPALWSFNVLIPPFGYHGRWVTYPTVLDPLGTGSQNWPVYVLIDKLIRSGQLPLWNPYQGTGAPLAADETWSTYFPFDLLYVFIGNQYWDYVWLLKLWTAGMLAYLLLKHMRLSFCSAMGGALAYCLSGAFIWSPFMNWTNVAILMPALLLIAMKCFDEPLHPSTITIGSLTFAATLLAAHLESLLIQFSYIFLFVVFEAATRRNRRKMFGLLTWAITIILGAGLTAFFLLPLQEYSAIAALFHGQWVGLASTASGLTRDQNPMVWWVGFFVPYLYSFFQTYFYAGLGSVFTWDNFPGYVGVCVLFLALLPLYPIVRMSVRLANRKYYFFFLAAAMLVLMKIFGIPPINWIGLLPGFQYVDFPRYFGSALAISFAGAAAYGIELVLRRDARNMSWSVLLFVLAVILSAVLSTVPHPLSPSGRYFPVSVAYLTLAIFYATLSAYVAAEGGADAGRTIVMLIVLELVSYIPKSLPVQYEAARVCALAGAGFLLVGGEGIKSRLELIELPRFLSNMRSQNHRVRAKREEHRPPISNSTMNNILTRRNVMTIVIVAALVLQFSISGTAPNGFPERYDPYTTPPYVKFLQANLGYQRAYSPDGLFFPPSAGVYALENLGEFSALMPSSFYAFSRVNLDNDTVGTDLVGNGYVRQNPAIRAQNEIRANIAFYSLLGVKYFVTSYTVLNMPVVFRDVNATIYDNPGAFPRTFLARQVEVASGESDAILKTRTLGWGTRNTTVIEDMPQNEIAAIDSAGGDPGVALIERYDPTAVSISVIAAQPSLLVLTDTYFPGWNAYLDGSAVPTYRAYGLVRGVFVPPGSHLISFEYEPTSFQKGAIISVLSGAILAILGCASIFRPKRRSR